MASIRKEIVLRAHPVEVWDAVRDVGALHVRLVPGFVVECRMDGDARVVKFANGVEARELIVDIDNNERRLVWSSVGGRLTHHNAAVQVFAEGAEHTRLVWVADLLPDEMADAISGMMTQGTLAMRRALEGGSARDA